MPSSYKCIYAVVNRIPKGRVATYGQVAELAGLFRQARQVGYALSALREGQKVAWHRVVNAKGEISLRSEPHFENVQRNLLEKEGVRFDSSSRLSLKRYQWKAIKSLRCCMEPATTRRRLSRHDQSDR